MRPPVDDQVIMTCKYGERVRNGNTEDHNGIDLRAPIGALIYAPEIMTIKRFGKGAKFGENFIVAEGSLLYKFMHCKIVNGINAGDKIAEGTIFAKSDGSGTNAPHLHFETWHWNTVCDPEEWFFNKLLQREFYPYMEGDLQRWYLQGA